MSQKTSIACSLLSCEVSIIQVIRQNIGITLLANADSASKYNLQDHMEIGDVHEIVVKWFTILSNGMAFYTNGNT